MSNNPAGGPQAIDPSVEISGFRPWDMILSPDGLRVYTSDHGTLRAYNAETGAFIDDWEIGIELGAIDVSPDGRYLAIAELRPEYLGSDTFAVPLYRFDLQTGTFATYTYEGEPGELDFSDVAWLDNGTALLTQRVNGSGGWTAHKLLDFATGSFTLLDDFSAGAVLTRGEDWHQLLVGPPGSAPVGTYAGVYDANLGIITGSNGFSSNNGVQAFSRQGDLIAEFLYGGGLITYDGDFGNRVQHTEFNPRFDTNILGLAFDESGDFLFVLDEGQDEIVQIRTSNWTIVREIPLGVNISYAPSGANNLLVGPDMRYFMVLTNSGVQRVDNPAVVDAIVGTPGNDTVNGTAGADTLIGDSGIDTTVGGLGNDVHYVDRLADNVVETAGGGIDTIRASANYVLADGVSVERLETANRHGTARINLTGNDLANTVTGNEGDNILVGGAGADLLQGLGGNDSLDGGSGADVMAGNVGDDLYRVDDAGDVVQESAGNGADAVSASFNYVLAAGADIEVLRTADAAGSQAIDLTGNDLANRLVGNAGGNVLDGGAGADLLQGLGGDDTFVVDNVGDVVTELAGGGFDTIRTALSVTLVDQVERLVLIGVAAIDGIGNGADNFLVGNLAANVLRGLDGIDTIEGGGGSDTLEGASGDDTLDGGADADALDGGEGNDTILGGSGADTILGAGNDDTLDGGADADEIDGGGGADAIEGGNGGDTLAGGADTDSFLYRLVGDFVAGAADTIEGFETGLDSVDLTMLRVASIDWTTTAGSNAVTIETTTGTMNLTIDGTIEDTDFLRLAGIFGTVADDQLQGTDAGELIDGGLGADTMVGGLGDDRFFVDQAGDIVTEEAAGGSDTVESAITLTLATQVENLLLVGNAAINGTGNGVANVILGNGAANVLNGGFGADTMNGGAGNDTYLVDSVGDQVVETSAAGGTDNVQSSVSFTLGANVEKLILTGTAAANGTGNTLANQLTGNNAANILNGGVGADTMNGGLGNDSYLVDNALDQAIETSTSGGNDNVQSLVSFALGANVESLTLTGAAAINGTGNTLANTLMGNNAANILNGGVGADTMNAGLGNDAYVVDNGLDQVIETSTSGGNDNVQSSVSFALGTNVESSTLTGTAAINGTGNTLANILTGNGAANTLNGGVGADTMSGGVGNDSYVVDNPLDKVIETSASGGTDKVTSSVGFALGTNVEQLILTGTGAINGTGNGLANVLTGNDGANVLNGGLGADTMAGGLGNDAYAVDNALDKVIETSAAGGTDRLTSSVSFTLGNNVENLTLAGTAAIDGTGNGLANTILGNGAANVLNGAAGADTMQGGLGSDTYVVDNVLDKAIETSATGGTDLVKSSVTFTLGGNVEKLVLLGNAVIDGTGNNGANTLTGNNAANVLKGLNGNDVIDGGAGNDELQGGAGNDSLRGNTGADGFVFNTALNAGTNLDHILDFVHAIDEIRLESAVFTTLAAGALSASAFRLGTAALDADDRILYDAASGALYYDKDGTGAAAAVQFATLDNMPATLNASDFLVI